MVWSNILLGSGYEPPETGGGGGFTPNYVDNGGTGYVDTALSITTTAITILFSGKLLVSAATNTYLLGPPAESYLRYVNVSSGRWLARDDSGSAKILNVGGFNFQENQNYAIMATADFTDLTSSTQEVYFNNSLAASRSDATSGKLTITGVGGCTLLGQAATANVATTYIAVYDGYIDPSTEFTTFFDAITFEPKGITTSVNGADPIFVMMGSATDFESDNFDVDTQGTATTSATAVWTNA